MARLTEATLEEEIEMTDIEKVLTPEELKRWVRADEVGMDTLERLASQIVSLRAEAEAHGGHCARTLTAMAIDRAEQAEAEVRQIVPRLKERAEKAESALAEQGRRMEELRNVWADGVVYLEELRSAITVHSCNREDQGKEVNWADLILKHGGNFERLKARWQSAEKVLTSAEGGENKS